jgi:ElaA protein
MKNILNISWNVKPFAELTVFELYEILKLRSAIFVVEQNCVFQDIDELDKQAHHCMGTLDGELVAYSRLFDKAIIYDKASIGRVIIHTKVRKYGLGKKLMEVSIHFIEQLFGKQPLKIGAQFYLKRFYEGLGFQQTSDIYMEDDIPHIYMEKA